MALTACKECGREISTEAVACPHCGAKPKRTSGYAKFALFILVLGAGLGIVSSHFQERRSQREADEATMKAAAMTPEQRKVEEKRIASEVATKALEERLTRARHACKRFVELTLHDPSSAEWGRVGSYWGERRKDGSYHIQVTVRAKNAFNATRLATYDCIVRDDGKTWRPISIRQQDVS